MRTIKVLIVMALSAAAMTSCEIETSGNGDLDGFWHLVRVDTLATGGVRDMSGGRVFWSVQVGLLNATDYDKYPKGYLFHFDKTDSTLRIFDPYADNRAEGDIKVEDPALLNHLGINALDETFSIERLEGSRMTLATERLRLSFKKM